MIDNRDKSVDNSIDKPKLPKLTRKQRAFVNELKKNPKQSATKAVLKTYNVTNYSTAGAIASENLKKPQIISHLEAYNDIVESTISNTVIEYGNSQNIKERTLAVETAKYVHDKLHGKAVQRNVTLNAGVTLQEALKMLK